VIFIVNTVKNPTIYPFIPLQDKMVSPTGLSLVHILLRFSAQNLHSSPLMQPKVINVFTKPRHLTRSQRLVIQTLLLTQSVHRIVLVVECTEMLVMPGTRHGLVQVKISKYITSNNTNYGSLLYSITYLKECDTDLLDLRSYLPTPWIRVLLKKLTGPQLVKKFLIFYGTRRFVTAFTSAGRLSLS